MKITFITGNTKKFEEVEHILEGWELRHADIDLAEIQGDRWEVIKEKAKTALSILHCPLIVEDVSLCCSALKGLPGPFAKDFLKILTAEGLVDLIHRYDDHKVQAICIAAYIEPDSEPVLFEGVIEGQVVPSRGNTKHGPYSFNTIFQPTGHDKTMGEMSMAEHATISHRKYAFEKLRKYLETHEAS